MEEPKDKKKKPTRTPPLTPDKEKEKNYNKIIQDLIKFMQSKESLFANPSSNKK
tara:strand:+ start:3064 stop:3225 length:162 start_codon:yes stop_codon:yes gene_type:complete